MSRWRFLFAAGVLVVTAAACSDDGESAETTASDATVAVPDTVADTTPDTTAAATTEPATTEPATTVEPASTWEQVVAPADCMCSDGSEFSFFVREADPTKVLFFMEGGGACFTAETCDPANPSYKLTVGYSSDFREGRDTGIFDFDNPLNPFADYSIVFVPYCTGDVHIGNTEHDYGGGVVVQHKGYVNGSNALATTAERFPDATEFVVAGESAGSVPSPLYAGLASDLYPDARITVLGDGSGAYPDVPAINGVIGSVWGTMNAVPDWPVNADVTPETWSFPGLFIRAGAHDPDITFARHDFAFDETQTFFAGLAGIPADDLVALIDQNEAQVEASGVTLLSYISPGDDHTILGKDEFYTHSVNGVLLVEWVTALLAGDPIDDVHCSVCNA